MEIRIVSKGGALPAYATEGSSGADLNITMPHLAEDALIDRVLKEKGIKHQ